MEVINPIYDTSFKFLMDDEKSAKILLSALLRQKVLTLEPRQQETTSPVDRAGGDITIYRLDYAAHVLTADGREEDVCVEIQKVWLQTELARFRKYLASQYADERNVQSDGRTPRHIVAIYLLGHNIAETDEPVVYCHGGALTDYYGKPLAVAGEGAFVRSLTHDVIIVQIPRLPDRPRNATERVLSIFDQRRALGSNRHLMEVPDTHDGGTDVEVLRRRLCEGACTSDMRRKMQLEDEFLWEVQSREEEIEMHKAVIERQKQELENQGKTLTDQGKTLEEQGKALEEQRKALEEQGKTLAEQRKAFEEQGKTLAEQSKAFEEQGKALDEQREENERQKMQIRSAIISLAKVGMSPDAISTSLGVGADFAAQVINGK